MRTADRDAVLQTLREHGLSKHSHVIGKAQHQAARWRCGAMPSPCLPPVEQLHKTWDDVSWRIAQLRDNPLVPTANTKPLARPLTPACTWP